METRLTDIKQVGLEATKKNCALLSHHKKIRKIPYSRGKVQVFLDCLGKVSEESEFGKFFISMNSERYLLEYRNKQNYNFNSCFVLV
jgi:hypothetical protein